MLMDIIGTDQTKLEMLQQENSRQWAFPIARIGFNRPCRVIAQPAGVWLRVSNSYPGIRSPRSGQRAGR